MVPNHTLSDNRKLGFFMIENDIFDTGMAARIGPYALTVYSYMTRLAGDKDECYPKIALIRQITGMAERTIIKSINTLISEGLITKKKTKTVNHYTIENHLQNARRAMSESTDCTSRTSQIAPRAPTDCTTDSLPLTRLRHTEENTIPRDRVLAVFNNWKEITNHPKSVLDKKREAKIKQAMKSYQDEDLIKAFRGCTKSPFHMGENDRKQKYDDITLILRDSDHIERFMEFDDKPPSKPTKPFNPREETRPRKPLS